MKRRFMQLPRTVVVGRGAVEEVQRVLEDLKMKGPVLLVADSTTYEVAGRHVHELLKEGFQVEVGLISDSTAGEVGRIEGLLKDKGCSFAIAVGGGRVIDVTKLASSNRGLDFVSIPTAAAHDGIASSRASIKRDGSTVSIGARAPVAVVADTEVISRAPYRLLASGCGDLISKYTSVRDWELARDRKGEEFSEYAAALSMMSAKMVLDSAGAIKGGGEESVRRVVKALISCGVAMSIAGSSRPASGSEHKFSHALDAIAPNPALHGEQCGVATIMMMRLHGGDWEMIRDALARIGAPTTAAELGVEDRHVVEALVRAREVRPERYTILEEVGLSEEDAWALARETGVVS